jgi:HEAT repeat protein
MPFFNAYGDSAATCTSQQVETLIKELKSISWSPPTEAGGEYSAELIEQLGNCRDPKAISAILTILGHAGGSLVVDAFAKIGPPSIPALVDKTTSGTTSEKKAALFYLGKLPEALPSFGHALSLQDKKQIQDAFKKSITDENYEVRESTIQAIGNSNRVYNDEDRRELATLLGSISRSDPYFVRRKAEDKETTIYPVRDKAAALLKKINP